MMYVEKNSMFYFTSNFTSWVGFIIFRFAGSSEIRTSGSSFFGTIRIFELLVSQYSKLFEFRILRKTEKKCPWKFFFDKHRELRDNFLYFFGQMMDRFPRFIVFDSNFQWQKKETENSWQKISISPIEIRHT